jgi:acyl carrier protein
MGRDIHVTFAGLTQSFEPGHNVPTPTGSASASADRFERDTLEILKRVSRRPIDPTLENELLADLGFDSLQVLELVGELEDHFGIAVPLNDLTHIKTVGQIVAEVRQLVEARETRS